MLSLELLVCLGPGEGMPWRRFTIDADASLGDLHEGIQDACGWLDCHLYAFIRPEAPFACSGWRIAEVGSESGCPDPAHVPMAVGLRRPGDRLTYWYDFGDDWGHDVLVERLARGVGGRRLVGGELAFPPEDCGGYAGYEEAVELVRRTARGGSARGEHEEQLLEWLGGWDPDEFDLETMRRQFDRGSVPGRGPGVPSLGAILGGRSLRPEGRMECEALHAQVRETHGPDQVLQIVRAAASADLFRDSFARLRGILPDSPRQVACFFELVRVTSERLDELAADDAPKASGCALDLAAFLIANQDQIPYDDDLNFHVEPLIVDAARWSCDGRPMVRPLRPLVTRIAALVEADGHGTLEAVARQLRKLSWTGTQRRRIREVLTEVSARAEPRSPLAVFAEEWVV